jgi:hypothetical protein
MDCADNCGEIEFEHYRACVLGGISRPQPCDTLFQKKNFQEKAVEATKQIEEKREKKPNSMRRLCFQHASPKPVDLVHL